MTDVRVHGAGDPFEIAAVIALLGRDHCVAPQLTALAAWKLTRRAALADTHRRPRPERYR